VLVAVLVDVGGTAVFVGVRVGVLVGPTGVFVRVFVGRGVLVWVGTSVFVAVRVTVGVLVGTVGVLVDVFTGVAEGVIDPQAV
jgi:hypothetical protein